MTRKKSTTSRKSTVRRQRDPIPWKYCVLTVLCGLLLVGGFFAAARQHFSTVGYGMKNADLRMQITRLKDENRKLELAKQRASSPVRITKAATNIGFVANPGPIVATALNVKSLNKDADKSSNTTETAKTDSNSADTIPIIPAKTDELSDNQIAALRREKN